LECLAWTSLLKVAAAKSFSPGLFFSKSPFQFWPQTMTQAILRNYPPDIAVYITTSATSLKSRALILANLRAHSSCVKIAATIAYDANSLMCATLPDFNP
jgi:hypothetical protein